MKGHFEGRIYTDISPDWELRTKGNPFMAPEMLRLLKAANPNEFRLVTHKDYCCCEYTTKINLLTFCRFRLNIKLNVIGLPASLCTPGYVGSLQSLVRDYKKRRGLFLILNLEERRNDAEAAVGLTLGNCVFTNRFTNFDEYLLDLKSGYRRRVSVALKKGAKLRWESVASYDFTNEMYQLYQSVFQHSRYPLECLTVEFFRSFPGELHCLYEGAEPLAFVLLHEAGDKLSFVFGGMDYGKRDQYDLYMNMLIFIIRKCIEKECLFADLGQTAENSKMRIGATVSPRYLCVFSGNPVINAILKKTIGVFSYKSERSSHSVWNADVAKKIEEGALSIRPAIKIS